MIDKEKMDIVINDGLSVLGEVMKSKKPKETQLKQARIASSILSTGVRFEATQNAYLGLKMRAAKMVLQNEEERRKYLEVSSPELKLLPQIPQKEA